MGILSARLDRECILMDPAEMEKEDLYRLMVERLASVHGIENPSILFESVMSREELISTCIGNGCAVPHCHSDLLDKTIFAAARLNPPRDFDTPDGKPVSLVFLMAGPDRSTGMHIKLLSKLSRLLHDPQFREELKNAGDIEDFHRILSRKDK